MIAPASESGTARAAAGGAPCAAATRGPEVAAGCGMATELETGAGGGAAGSTRGDEVAPPFGEDIGAWSDSD
jgi:hypothetical protein